VVAFSEAVNYEAEGHGVLVTAVNPGLVATEGFPQTKIHPRFVMKPDRIGEAIVRVIREDIAPEFTVPRWLGPFQVFRVITPPLYRWGIRTIRKVGYRTTGARR
jgi:short-subunit dehydrogenase